MKLTKRFRSKKYNQAEEIRLVHSGKDYFDTLDNIILSAKNTLHFQTYIFEEDETGMHVAESLKQAAKRGVNVFLVIDAFGSSSLSNAFIIDMKKAGVHFRFFGPLFSLNTINLGRRMHHKVVVADKYVALIAGINISNKYKGIENERAWLDYGILVKGAICEQVDKICSQILNKEFEHQNMSNAVSLDNDAYIQFRQNDRLRGKNQISRSYIHRIRNAKNSIIIVSSYFLPGTRIKHALIRAAKKGVSVNIILSGIADVPILGMATNYLYASLLKNGITIYEWQKSVLHGKIALIDDQWATVGSFNINHLSALSSIELNVDVMSESFSSDLKKHLNEVITTGCKKINYQDYVKQNTRYQRMRNAIAYFIIRTFMKLIGLFPRVFSWSSAENAGL
jgi:cardiolipin synthase A/B